MTVSGVLMAYVFSQQPRQNRTMGGLFFPELVTNCL